MSNPRYYYEIYDGIFHEAEDPIDGGHHYVPDADYDENIHGESTDEIEGFGYRWTMPGYLDCGEWEVFDDAASRDAAANECMIEMSPASVEDDD